MSVHIDWDNKKSVPENWVSAPAKNATGIRYKDPVNPRNEVRVMKGQPDHKYESMRNDYVHWSSNGRVLDKNGNSILPGKDGFSKPSDHPDAHIPLKDFKFDPSR